MAGAFARAAACVCVVVYLCFLLRSRVYTPDTLASNDEAEAWTKRDEVLLESWEVDQMDFETIEMMDMVDRLAPRAVNDSDYEYISGYQTPIIRYLHGFPRYTLTFKEATNEFTANSTQYWQGTTFVPSLIAAISIIILLPCGIAYCICRAKNFCGRCDPRPYNPSFVTKVKIASAVLFGLGICFGAVALAANGVVDNQFIPIIDVPAILINDLSTKMTTLQKEAMEAGITVPNQVVTINRVINATEKRIESFLPSIVLDAIDEIESARSYVFYIFICLAMLLWIVGIGLVFAQRGNILSIFVAIFFVTYFLILLIAYPTLWIDITVADFCYDSNEIILSSIQNRFPAQVYEYFLFYLMCPPLDITPTFLGPMINETEKLLQQLEEDLANVEDTESNGQAAEIYEKRINQTKSLLELEQSLTTCEETSEEYQSEQETLCRSSLKWNWILTIFLVLMLVAQVLIICIGACGHFVLNENNPAGGSYYVELVDQPGQTNLYAEFK